MPTTFAGRRLLHKQLCLLLLAVAMTTTYFLLCRTSLVLFLEMDIDNIPIQTPTNYVISQQGLSNKATSVKKLRKNLSEKARAFQKLNSIQNDTSFLDVYTWPVNGGDDNDPALVSSQSIKRRSPVVLPKLILLWYPLYEGWNFLSEGLEAFSESNCSETRCEVTTNRSRLEESNAVVFHIRGMSLLDIPRLRLPHHKWVFFSLEPPPLSYFSGFPFMHNMFNWTMTYRTDSDVVISYGSVMNSTNRGLIRDDEDPRTIWNKKSKMAVWMVSHCSTAGNREGFVRELQKYLDVDILGSCGWAMCPFNKTTKCLEAFAKKYKFFLAFENAICKGYVTEKFFRILKYNIVPVVLGGADYEAVAPPHSYIDALAFGSPRELASYMYRVSKDFDLYMSYFKWKENGSTTQDSPSHCELCRRLHSDAQKAPKVYRDITSWWVKKSKCRKWKSG